MSSKTSFISIGRVVALPNKPASRKRVSRWAIEPTEWKAPHPAGRPANSDGTEATWRRQQQHDGGRNAHRHPDPTTRPFLPKRTQRIVPSQSASISSGLQNCPKLSPDAFHSHKNPFSIILYFSFCCSCPWSLETSNQIKENEKARISWFLSSRSINLVCIYSRQTTLERSLYFLSVCLLINIEYGDVKWTIWNRVQVHPSSRNATHPLQHT